MTIQIPNAAEKWEDRTDIVREICMYLHDNVIRVDANCLTSDSTIEFYGCKKLWKVVRQSSTVLIMAPPEHESFLALKYGVR